ncbi:MAG: flavohemoglobin expression-modulating QEGLA motif protein [Actinomycetota bacterium]
MKIALEVDRVLVEVGEALDLLLHVSPVNSEAAWSAFADSDFEALPAFEYRSLSFDPDALKRRLYELPLDDVENPTLANLFREKRLELDRQIIMLEDRETSRFLYGSLAVFGDVDDVLLADAEKLLAEVPPQAVRDLMEPDEFCRLARDELHSYAHLAPDLSLNVEVRDDVPGLMVARGSLLVSSRVKIGRARAGALIQHEIGTHVVTAANGRLQPLCLFAIGLPGYEQTQEGLAVFAEYVSGGLDRARLRLLAARVVAVYRLLEGASFGDVFLELHRDRGFRPQSAWSVTMRVYRSGGYTKDAIYLRGLAEIMSHLHSGGSLDPLLVGKVSLAQIPLAEELLAAEILKPPTLWPHWLKAEGAEGRLERVRGGLAVSELVTGET